MQSYRHSFELNELPPSLNKYTRLHFQERNRIFKKLKNLVWLNVRENLPLFALTKYKITCTRHTCSPLDPFDNLPGSFKVIIDGLVEAKVIEDDKWTMADQITARQVKVSKKKDQKIVIEIEDCEHSRMATKEELDQLKVRHV